MIVRMKDQHAPRRILRADLTARQRKRHSNQQQNAGQNAAAFRVWPIHLIVIFHEARSGPGNQKPIENLWLAVVQSGRLEVLRG
jgi:hypothetical protein